MTIDRGSKLTLRGVAIGLAVTIVGAVVMCWPSGGTAQEQWNGGVTHVDTVAAPALRKNLIGDPDHREVTVYLPPGYSAQTEKRYPVIFLLHGFGADHRQFMNGQYQNFNVRISMDSLIRAGAVSPMIVVMPNGRTFFGGSFFINSPVTGAWEDFIVRDLVAHVDGKYRTKRTRKSRGIAGHSMGGFGALRIAMRHPDKFSAVYAMSPCCLASMDAPERTAGWKAAVGLTRREDYQAAGFTAHLLYGLAAAYSPNIGKPPLFADLPYRLDSGMLVPVPSVAEKWKMGPLAMASSHLGALRRLAIAFDAGDADGLTDIPPNVRALDSLLTSQGIPHVAEVYEGNHGNRVRARFETRVFPFLSRSLQ